MLGLQLEKFLAMMAAEKGASQNTIAAYEHDLKQFLEFCPSSNIECLTKQQVEKFMHMIKKLVSN